MRKFSVAPKSAKPTGVRAAYAAIEELSAGVQSEWGRESLERVWLDVADQYESLPVSDEVDCPRPHVFVLIAGEWYGTRNYEDTTALPGATTATPYLRYTVQMQDGTGVTGVAAKGSWANCDADGNPSLPEPSWRWPADFLANDVEG